MSIPPAVSITLLLVSIRPAPVSTPVISHIYQISDIIFNGTQIPIKAIPIFIDIRGTVVTKI